MKRTLFAILTSVLCLTMQAQDQITATIETFTQGREWNLNISLANATPYVSFQFDVILPQGVTYTDVTPDQRISSLTVTTGMVSDNKLRVTAYNANSQATLTSGTGNILSLRLTSETTISGGTIKVTNCLFTSLQGTDYTETTLPAVTVQIPDVTSVTLYKLTYIVDGEVYKESTYEYGTPITPEPAPQREGHTFSGWSEIPSTMPAHDVSITGTFSINSYKLTYIVDGEVYKEYFYEYGIPITPEPAPQREGHTFSGWSEIPSTMPAHDVSITGTFSINSYKLTYIVDGEVYKELSLEYGALITPESAPKREGHTFSGWSEIPSTMPAHDVSITGTFSINSINSYKLTYIVDGEVYKEYFYEYGTPITPEPAPQREGHTFSGWSEIPTTMPAHDVSITGTFSINSYKLTYIVDGEVYKEFTYEYGTPITPEPAPQREGHTFSGWSEIPSTMPARDVSITGTFSINSYKLTYIVDGEVYKELSLEYGASITPEPAPTKEDWEFSGWKEEIPSTMPAHDVTITGSFDVFTSITSVEAESSENQVIYNINGVRSNKIRKGLNIVNGRKVVR